MPRRGLFVRLRWLFVCALFASVAGAAPVEAFGGAFTVLEDAETVTITAERYVISITKEGFRYAFLRPDGATIAPAHPEAGLLISAPNGNAPHPVATASLVDFDAQRAQLLVSTDNNDLALVSIYPYDHTVRFQVVPSEPGTYVIDAQTGAPGKGYGLGDHGGALALDISDDDFTSAAAGRVVDYRRFVTNFTVFPGQGFAQVLFWQDQKRVEVNQYASRLGLAGARQLDDLYYFVGTLPQIYAAYKGVKSDEGYPDYKPKYAMFEVGWEAYGALGVATSQAAVTRNVQEYLDRGYRLKWAVAGSRTWRGNPTPFTAGTTRFGMWDDGSPGSTDPPRYPDPAAFKRFMAERDIKLLIGLRINMDEENPYYLDARRYGYLLPEHPLLIDVQNPVALDWYIEGVNLWGVDGFKEDLCCGSNTKYGDAKANKANERLMRQGSYVIVRNSAWSVPGDISRREDTEYRGYYGTPADLTGLGIAYAASAAPNYYPDIVGGTDLQDKQIDDNVRRYLARNAAIAAAMPAMAFGFPPWQLGDERYADYARRAALWHSRHAPYIYSAAVDSFNTGFPHTLTPLMIAYPDDPALYDLYPSQWMLGPSLLAVGACYTDYANIPGDECTAEVRLPAGTWIDPDTGYRYEGGAIANGYQIPLGKIPVFVGGKGVVVERDLASEELLAKVYPLATGGSQYQFTYPDGVTTSTIINDNTTWRRGNVAVVDETSNRPVQFRYEEPAGALVFSLVAGHNYRLVDEYRVSLPLVEGFGGGGAPLP